MADLKTLLLEAGLTLSEEALKGLDTYHALLMEWNEKMDLTSVSQQDMAARHFLDSLLPLKIEGLIPETGRLIDVGTGAGFPGLAMKMACPEMGLTLLDSLDKRINFLKDTCAKTGIEDVTCIHARAEEIPEGYRESFDFAVSRAVARLNLLCELCLPYVKKGGAFIAMKGQEMDTEIKEAYTAIKTMGAVV